MEKTNHEKSTALLHEISSQGCKVQDEMRKLFKLEVSFCESEGYDQDTTADMIKPLARVINNFSNKIL